MLLQLFGHELVVLYRGNLLIALWLPEFSQGVLFLVIEDVRSEVLVGLILQLLGNLEHLDQAAHGLGADLAQGAHSSADDGHHSEAFDVASVFAAF